MTTKTKIKKPAPTTAQALRRLRKFLPPGFKKLSGVTRGIGYVYYGLLTVEVFGVCEYKASEKEKGSCVAHTILVRPTHPWTTRGRRGNGGVRGGSYRVRKDGTFNVEAIGMRIQAVLDETRERMEANQKRADHLKQQEKDKTKNTMAVRKILRRLKLPKEVVSFYNGAQIGSKDRRAVINVYGDEITLKIEDLDLKTLEKLLCSI